MNHFCAPLFVHCSFGLSQLTSHALPDLQLVHHVIINQCQVEHNTNQITLLVIIATIFVSVND